MRDQAEYQQLLQRWVEGGEISREEQVQLEHLLASDPDFARSHQQLLRVEESVQKSRHALLSERDSVRLRSTVDALSRSVPTAVASGGGLVAKIVGSAFLLLVVVAGVFLLTNRNSTDSPLPSITTGGTIQEEVSLEENGAELPPIESPAVSSKDQTAESQHQEKERPSRHAGTKGSGNEVNSVANIGQANEQLNGQDKEGKTQPRTLKQNSGDIKGNGFFQVPEKERTN